MCIVLKLLWKCLRWEQGNIRCLLDGTHPDPVRDCTWAEGFRSWNLWALACAYRFFYAALQKASVWSCFSPIHSCLSPPPNLNSEEIICLLQQDGFCWKVNYSSSPGKHSPRPAASSLLHSMHSFFFFLSPTWWSHTAPATSLTTYYWQQRQSFLHPRLPQGIIRGTPISLSFAQQYME